MHAKNNNRGQSRRAKQLHTVLSSMACVCAQGACHCRPETVLLSNFTQKLDPRLAPET